MNDVVLHVLSLLSSTIMTFGMSIERFSSMLRSSFDS